VEIPELLSGGQPEQVPLVFGDDDNSIDRVGAPPIPDRVLPSPLPAHAEDPATGVGDVGLVGWLCPATLAVMYVAGVGLCCLWLAWGRILLLRVELAARRPPPWVLEVYENLPGTRRARLRVSPRADRPFSYGTLRPTIMLPAEMCDAAYARSLPYILRHEQSHIQRRDAWGNAVMNVAFPLLYPHPLFWSIRNRVQLARELIADDWATLDGCKAAYAEVLLRLLRGRDWSLAGPMGVLGVFRFRSPVARRIKMLLQRNGRLATGLSRPCLVASSLSALVAVVLMSSLFGLRFAAAGDKGTGDKGDRVAANSNSVSPSARGERSAESVTTGVVVAITHANIAARTGGVVMSVNVGEGDQVEAGQLLVQIDDKLEQLEVEAMSHAAEVSEAAANSVNVEVAKKAAELTAVDLAEAEDARRRVPAAISDFELRRRKFTAERQRLEAEQAEVDLRAARANYTKQRTEAMAAETKLERHRVSAPFDGTVAEMFVREGEWVAPGEPICYLVNLDRVRIQGHADARLYNPEELYGREVAIVVVRARGELIEVPGKITYVSPVVDSDGQYRFWAEASNLKRNGFFVLRPGMPAEIALAESSARSPSTPVGSGDVDPPSVERPSTDPAEIQYLTELVAAHEETWKRIHALCEAGAVGGSAENEAAARHRFLVARAQLALTKGNKAEAIEHYEAAVEAAEQYLEAAQAAYDAGTLKLNVLLDAQAQRANTKLALSRLQK
jgi:multidrug efflux pump subunit AcrA (membrane-fusion protein)